MATPSVPLSMLQTKDVPYEWHDGVALVAQLIEQVRPIGLAPAPATIPGLESIALETPGWLTLSSDSEHALPAMPGAARVLQQLLSGTDQPPQLRLFVMQAAASDSTDSLDAFADELSKWERPNRVAKLVALHTRALATIGPAALTAEALARQKLRASRLDRRTDDLRTKSTLRSTLTKQRTSAASLVVGAVIVAAAAAVAALEWRYVLGRSVAPAPPPQVAVVDDTPPPADSAPVARPSPPAARSSGSRSTASPRPVPGAAPASAPVAAAEAELARAQELFDQQDYATARAAFERVLASLGNSSSAQAEEIRQAARNLDEVARAAVDAAAVSAQEYRSGDPGVVAPIAEAHLPPKPDPRTPPEQLQVMELRINAQGLVDSAKFVINRPTYRNAWWPAAAKTWKFKPATKDGRAVRYVMRIVMDDSDSTR